MVYFKSRQPNVELVRNFDTESYEILELLKEFKVTNDDKITQISRIESEINKMIKYHSKSLFYPSYPRIIVDSWDYDHSITKRLIDLYNLYLKL